MFYRKANVAEIIVDDIQIKDDSKSIWLWVAIEPKDKEILSIIISKERNMFAVERFLSNILEDYDPHLVSTGDGTGYSHQACRFLKL